jgi:hypothetical protein
MQSELPDVTGNVIIVFGFLLSSAVLLKYGWEQNMFGGFVFNLEGAVVSAVLLFFSVLLGVLFRNNRPGHSPHHFSPNVSVSSEPQSLPVESFVDSSVEEDPASEEGEYGGYNSEAYAAYCSDYYDYYNEGGGGE